MGLPSSLKPDPGKEGFGTSGSGSAGLAPGASFSVALPLPLIELTAAFSNCCRRACSAAGPIQSIHQSLPDRPGGGFRVRTLLQLVF
jgi:hypothetical protein